MAISWRDRLNKLPPDKYQSIVDEPHTIPSDTPKIIKLIQVPKQDEPSSVSVRNGITYIEVDHIPTSPEEFQVDYEVGTIRFHDDANGVVYVSYIGTGCIVWAEDVNELGGYVEQLDVGKLSRDGTLEMTGDLDMGGNDITNVGTVDGVDISAHNHTSGSGTPQIPTGGIQNGAVTEIKIANGAVATDKIQNDAVDNNKLKADDNSLGKISSDILKISNKSIVITHGNPATSDLKLSPNNNDFCKVLFYENGTTRFGMGVAPETGGNSLVLFIPDEPNYFFKIRKGGYSSSYPTLLSLDKNGNLNVNSNTLYVDALNYRVGIGTSSPITTLDVNGYGRFTQDLIIEKDLSAGATLYVDVDNHRVGIGKSSPEYKLDVMGDVRIGTPSTNTLYVDAGNYRVGIRTSSPSYTLDVMGDVRIGTPSTNILCVDAGNYRVGIGTSSPNYKLDVKGNMNVDSDSNTLYVDADNHRVGIGTTSPAYKLDVSGDVRASGRLISSTSSIQSRYFQLIMDPYSTVTGYGMACFEDDKKYGFFANGKVRIDIDGDTGGWIDFYSEDDQQNAKLIINNSGVRIPVLYLGDLRMANNWVLQEDGEDLIWVSPNGKKYRMVLEEIK